MMNLYKEAKLIVDEAIEQVGTDEIDALQEFIWQSVDGHEVVIYYQKAIEFCATQDTSDGEQYLEDCGGIAQDGDTFGQIACRIAYATILQECDRVLSETLEEMETCT